MAVVASVVVVVREDLAAVKAATVPRDRQGRTRKCEGLIQDPILAPAGCKAWPDALMTASTVPS